MAEEKFQTISPGKAIINFIFDMALFVVAPFFLRDWLNANYPLYASYITDDIFNLFITLGVFSAITTFFKSLWKPGTRPHGLFSAIYAGYHLYYILMIFGGITALGTPDFGIFSVSLMGYGISINLSILAYIFLAQGIITLILYLFEMVI